MRDGLAGFSGGCEGSPLGAPFNDKAPNAGWRFDDQYEDAPLSPAGRKACSLDAAGDPMTDEALKIAAGAAAAPSNELLPSTNPKAAESAPQCF